jgi:hypothetical protein
MGLLEPHERHGGGDGEADLKDIAAMRVRKPIYWVREQWAVTAYGVQEVHGKYDIEKNRLWEVESDWGWEDQLAEKNWVDISEFREAMKFAREKFEHLKR